MKPNQHVLGTLIGHAVRDHNYEYLTSLVRVMMQLDSTPNQTILEMLDTAAARKPKVMHVSYPPTRVRGTWAALSRGRNC